MTRIGPFALLLLALVLPSASAASQSYTIHAGTHTDGSMYFTPSTFNVAQGDSVTIHVINDDVNADKSVKTPHDLAILGLGESEDQESESGECPQAQEREGPKVAFEVCKDDEVTKTFTADKAGTFDFVCEVPGHADNGMKGTFTVAASSATPTNKAPGLLLPGLVLSLAVAALARKR